MVVERLAIKHFDASKSVSEILEMDQQRRAVQKEMDDLKAKCNGLSKEIGALMKQGQAGLAEVRKKEVGAIKEKIRSLELDFESLGSEQESLLLTLPNIPCHEVPYGSTPQENRLVRQHGQLRPSIGLLPHWEIASKYGLIDFETGTKVAGAGFPIYKGKGARLQRALLNYFLDYNTAAGYLEVQPPILINPSSGYGTGQLPDKEGQMYYIGLDDLYLAPTAEVPITNMYRDVLLQEKELPIKLTGYTPCFRREAGSYGKDVRGLNRVHQFDKVEIVQISSPETSYRALDEMVAHVEGLLLALGLPYRILALCGGDMSFASALTYDFEVYSPAQDRWLEVSSVSNFETFQANRLKLRYKNNEGVNSLVHTLNGSSLAFPRIVATLLENYQSHSGIDMPEILAPYCGFSYID